MYNTKTVLSIVQILVDSGLIGPFLKAALVTSVQRLCFNLMDYLDSFIYFLIFFLFNINFTDVMVKNTLHSVNLQSTDLIYLERYFISFFQ
jgi:hypothetical protein